MFNFTRPIPAGTRPSAPRAFALAPCSAAPRLPCTSQPGGPLPWPLLSPLLRRPLPRPLLQSLPLLVLQRVPQRVSHLLPVALLLGAMGATPAAFARPSDALHVYGSVGYFHDDNLFRLPDDAPAYDGQRSDSATQSVLGVFFDKTYSRQRVFLQAKRSKVAFRHFDQLDYTGKDYLGTLNWQVGNHLEGTLGASYAQTLAPYTDFRSRERNLRVQRREFFDGAWRFHPSYRVRTALSRDKFTYEVLAQRLNNRTEDVIELGGDYLPASGSTAGLVVRRLKGRYLDPIAFNGVRLNDDYTQDEYKAKVLWRVTQLSTIQALAGYAKRKHRSPGASDIDQSGFNGRLTGSVRPRAKLGLNAAIWREFTPVESVLVTYALSNGASVSANWDATTKLRVDAAVSSERRAYEGRFSQLDPQDLKDTVRRASLNGTWTLRPTILLSAGLSHERRSGSLILGTGSYKANTVSVNASAQF